MLNIYDFVLLFQNEYNNYQFLSTNHALVIITKHISFNYDNSVA